jgi:hypothetical protein
MRKKLFLLVEIMLISFLLKGSYVLAGCDNAFCAPPDCQAPRCDTCSWCVSSAPSSGGVFGKITLPKMFKYGELTSSGGGLIAFFNNIIRLLIVIGGIWAFINLILAGYGFLGAGEDPKKMEAAWQKIWQSMLGLLFILSSFVLAAIFGYLLFGNPTAILKPRIYGP